MGKFSGVADVKNRMKGTDSPDYITGGNLADRIYGNDAFDYLYGGASNDYIDAGDGDDRLFGEAGDDTLFGGGGSDTFTIETGEGNDTIIDYDPGDWGDVLTANYLTNATSGVFIKRGNNLIIAEGTVNLTGDADGDGNDAEDLATEVVGIQALTSAAARRAGMRSIVSNLTTSATIKNYFTNGKISLIYATGWATVRDQTIMTNLVDYNTGLKYFNQAVSNAAIVRGTKVADYIFASANDQKLYGSNGDDVYYIDAKTNVVISDTSGTDSLIFDDNDVGADVYAYTKQGNDLYVTFDDGSGGVVASATVKNFFLRNGSQIEKVGADDDGDLSAGTAYDASSLGVLCENIAAISGAGKVLRGTQTDDRFTINIDQTAYGLRGDDEYTVTAGKAVIVDNSGSADIVNADHVATENDGVYIKRGNDLIILDGSDDPDGVGGFADADAAITAILGGGASYDTAGERRAVLNTLIKMNDSITIKNYFSIGEVETINALNNTAIEDLEILSNLIDYRTGLLLSDNSTGKSRVYGTSKADYILASVSNQKLYGKNGSDIYAIPGGLSNVEIYDTDGTLDKIKFINADFDAGDTYDIQISGNDLVVSVTDAGDGDSTVIIKDYLLTSAKYLDKIEEIEDHDAANTVYLKNSLGSRHYIYGSTGDDTIEGPAYGSNNWIYGNDGDDSIIGGEWNDRLRGEAGNDTLCGNSFSNDYLYGGEGSDVYEIIPGSANDRIEEEDATADDTDKVVFKGVDFSLASTTITLTRNGNDLTIAVDEGDGIVSDVDSWNYYAGGSSQVEVIEDAYGNAFTIATGAVSGTINAAITFAGDDNASSINMSAFTNNMTVTSGAGGDILLASSGNDTINGGNGNNSLFGWDGNDTITGGDDVDMIQGGNGNDYINAGAGNDAAVQGNDGDDTLQGGLGDDNITGGNDNDVFLYDLDSGNAAGNDTVTDFTIGEDVIRFTTGANNQLGNFFRNEIAIAHSTPGGTDNLLIGYNWDEAAQDYTNSITISNWDDSAGAVVADVIEFVTSEGTVALSHQDIIDIIDATQADDDAPTTLAGVHDDGNDNGGVLLGTIAGLWS